MPSNSDLLKRRQDAIPAGLGILHPIFCERAQNAELWDVEGNRFIDFASGIAVVNTGHLHPKVKAAVSAELEKMSHVCFQVTPYERYIELAERLNALVPGDTPKKTLLLSTGAEAVENAVKIARAHTGRSAVIAFSGAFHGRTLFALGLTGKITPYKTGFGPFPAEIFHAPYPIDYHGMSVDAALAAIDRLFAGDVDPARVAAMIVEPVLGEGGFYPAPPEFLQALRGICDQHGIALILDEIQTGFARTGRTFAVEYAGIEPDLITMAKSLAGGFPLSAVTGKAEIMDGPKPGGLGGTYAGSPISCAAALASINVMEEEKLANRALRLGDLIAKRIRALSEEPAGSCIGEFRYLGRDGSHGTRVRPQHARTRRRPHQGAGAEGGQQRFGAPLLRRTRQRGSLPASAHGERRTRQRGPRYAARGTPGAARLAGHAGSMPCGVAQPHSGVALLGSHARPSDLNDLRNAWKKTTARKGPIGWEHRLGGVTKGCRATWGLSPTPPRHRTRATRHANRKALLKTRRKCPIALHGLVVCRRWNRPISANGAAQTPLRRRANP